jgi:2-polyprenyl-3-methyl-5-hydroxy-6-metoxy-1,4-benzoquinol methylase
VSVNGTITPAAVAAIARAIYTKGPIWTRALQHWRPFICPFDVVMEEVTPGSFVLDIGCGGGLLLGALASTKRISGGVGFDFSSDAIQVAVAMVGSLKFDSGLKFQQLSALDSWPEGPFTAVTLVDVMHHVPVDSQRDVFKKAASMLRPGSRLIYKDIAPRPRWRAWANTVHDLILARQWVHYVPMSTIEEWAKADGLLMLRTYRINRLWYGHHFAVFVRPD